MTLNDILNFKVDDKKNKHSLLREKWRVYVKGFVFYDFRL